jgi:sugar/nucleoside kinase (ribokinase family)
LSAGGAPLWPRRRTGGCDVVGVGQACVDHVATVERLPGVGGKLAARDYTRLPGGQIATAMLACARLGLRAAFVGTLGDDEDGRLALAPLRAAGVDLAGVRLRPGVCTQTSEIWIERASGERTIVWFRDPRLALRPEEVPVEAIARARALHLDAGDLPAALAAARAARVAGVPSVLDADAPAPGVEELLASVDFPVVSRSFAETLHGSSKLGEALDRMLRAGARMAVVTLGERGALARTRDRWIESPGFEVEIRDTTGAGDAFHAGFLWGLLEGLDAEAALRAANAAAALNCRALGAQGGLPDRGELEAFLAGARRKPWVAPAPGKSAGEV